MADRSERMIEMLKHHISAIESGDVVEILLLYKTKRDLLGCSSWQGLSTNDCNTMLDAARDRYAAFAASDRPHISSGG